MDNNIAFIESIIKSVLPLATFMDVKILQAQDETYSCLVPLNDNTKNHFNSVHAAIQWAGAELLGGVVWIKNMPSDDYLLVLKEMNIKFVKPVMEDVTATTYFSDEQALELNHALADNGRHDFDLHSEIKDKAGNVLANTHAQYAVRRKR